MKYMNRAILAGAVVTLLLASGCDFTQDPQPSASLAAFGALHSPLGDATLNQEDGSMTVAMNGPGGVAVEIGTRTNLNVYFEPIEMPVGSLFETAVVGQVNGEDKLLGRIIHTQTATRTTRIGVDFHDLWQYTSSSNVSVATYLDGVQTSSKTLPADSTGTLGFVDSAESGWATSYHWVWINGSWILIIDPAPSETFAFASEPDVKHPFNYLVFTVEGVEGISQPSTMEFFGQGLADFTIVGENDRRLIF